MDIKTEDTIETNLQSGHKTMNKTTILIVLCFLASIGCNASTPLVPASVDNKSTLSGRTGIHIKKSEVESAMELVGALEQIVEDNYRSNSDQDKIDNEVSKLRHLINNRGLKSDIDSQFQHIFDMVPKKTTNE